VEQRHYYAVVPATAAATNFPQIIIHQVFYKEIQRRLIVIYAYVDKTEIVINYSCVNYTDATPTVTASAVNQCLGTGTYHYIGY
jgi:hypothetical protein